MARKKKFRTSAQPSDTKPTNTNKPVAAFLIADDYDSLCVSEYVSLDKCPEVVTAALRIAELIGSMTIKLMSNTKNGDVRIKNELSRKIDIDPMPTMTRMTWMTNIIMNLLLYGKGNSVVVPHTYNGIIQSLEPIAANRVQFEPKGNSYRDYSILIDGKARLPEDVLHFVFNPDKYYLWKGTGINVILQDLVQSLKQAAVTEKAFMESKWKPSLIVKVDALTEEFSGKEGRQKLLEEYVKSANVGEPWMIPADQFSVEQVRPLTLADLAIDKNIELDKRTVASIFGVPPFLLGVGEFNKAHWNHFVETRLRTLILGIEQEMTKKLIINPNWYISLNYWSLKSYDMAEITSVFTAYGDRGWVAGNEARDRIGLEWKEGLDEYKVLENYIPIEDSGNQSKLNN